MPKQSLFAIILAAGESRRFGSSKQLAIFQGESLVSRAVRLAEAVCGDHSVLVVGSDWKTILSACAPQRGFFVRNESYATGLAGSIACGVQSVAHAADAVLLVMADQPLVTEGYLNSLISRWREAPEMIVASEYAGVKGPPVVFPKRCFDSLVKLQGDRGARSLLHDRRFSVVALPCDDAAVDIDTPADLARY
jgi:molybdenum cofactor cytidylyltransferase